MHEHSIPVVLITRGTILVRTPKSFEDAADDLSQRCAELGGATHAERSALAKQVVPDLDHPLLVGVVRGTIDDETIQLLDESWVDVWSMNSE